MKDVTHSGDTQRLCPSSAAGYKTLLHHHHHRTLIAFRLLCWQVVMLTDSCTDVNTRHASSPCGPLDREALWHCLGSICTWALRSVAQIRRAPFLHFTPTVKCLPHIEPNTPVPPHSPHASQPFRQNMPFRQPLKRRGVHDSAPEVTFALSKYTSVV